MCVFVYISIYINTHSLSSREVCVHCTYTFICVIYMLHEHRYFMHIPVFAAGSPALFITLSFFLSATQMGPRFLIEGMNNTRLC